MKGLVTINKVYKDGRRETVMDGECNSLTDGLSRTVAGVFGSDPTKLVSNYKFHYFQLGTSSYYDSAGWDEALPASTSKTFYSLHSPFTSVDDYGAETNVRVVSLDTITAKENFKTLTDVEFTTSSNVLGVLTPESTANVNETTLLVKITLDENAAVGKTIREAGLFVKNIENKVIDDRPILAAYKSMNEPIVKTDEFSLEIEWVIALSIDYERMENKGKVISFRPSKSRIVKNGESSQGVAKYKREDNFVKYLQSNETYTIEIESSTPVEESGYLTWSYVDPLDQKTDTAISGVHYEVSDSTTSSIFWAAGAQSVTIPFTCLDTSSSFGQKVLIIKLDNFSGKEVIADPRKNHLPNEFVLLLRSNRAFPVLDLASERVNITPSSSDITVAYLDVSSEAGQYVFDGQLFTSTLGHHKVLIPAGDVSGDYEVCSVIGTSLIVSSYNTLSGATPTSAGEALYQQATHSNDFRHSYNPVGHLTNLSYKDLSANINELRGSTKSEWYKQNIVGPKSWYTEWPTSLSHIPSDNPLNPRPSEIGQSSFFHDLTPDGSGLAQFVYANKLAYTYPTEDKLFSVSGTRITPNLETSGSDNLGRTIDGYPEVTRFSSAMSSVIYSVYVKKQSGTVLDPLLDMVNPTNVTSSKYLQLAIGTKGYPGIGAWFAGKDKVATFQWSDTTSGLEVLDVSTNGGAFVLEDGGASYTKLDAGVFSGTNGGDDETKYSITDKWAKDGWYRAWISATIPAELKDGSYWAIGSDSSGAISNRYIYPAVGDTLQASGGLPGLSIGNEGDTYEVPLVCSGSLLAWQQYETVLVTPGAPPALASNGFLPRPYQNRQFSWFSPKGGAWLTDSGITSTTFTF